MEASNVSTIAVASLQIGVFLLISAAMTSYVQERLTDVKPKYWDKQSKIGTRPAGQAGLPNWWLCCSLMRGIVKCTHHLPPKNHHNLINVCFQTQCQAFFPYPNILECFKLQLECTRLLFRQKMSSSILDDHKRCFLQFKAIVILPRKAC